MDSKTYLITGATGDTGSQAVRLLLGKGHRVRAFIHKHDERSAKEPLGLAEFVENNKQCFEVDSSVAVGTGKGVSN